MALLRFRRYRVFVFAAAFVLFLLFRLSQNPQPDARHTAIYHGSVPPQSDSGSESGPAGSDSGQKSSNAHGGSTSDARPDSAAAPGRDTPDVEAYPVKAPAEAAPAEAVPAAVETSWRLPQLRTSLEVKGAYGLPTGHPPPPPAAPLQTAPPTPVPYGNAGAEGVNLASSVGAVQNTAVPGESPMPSAPIAADTSAAALSTASVRSSSAVVHWTKMPENFPVPEESLILLPTGSPKPVPRIQHHFAAESDAERDIREARLASVRDEMLHAWSGYRTYAWTHDELAPLSKGFRNPFCGWAASLVDGLDTLWIMDMFDEFDEAYHAVKLIDFTTTPFRTEIPVFETVIRYLGGLIGAYDVSGGPSGRYPALLDKAVELAEILMGIFDTPNRMPILYYNWKPSSVAEPKSAPTSASVAELGSLTMEFTRLAQLTGHHKYYDAIARIIDALEEWQNRPNGTALPGLFPETIDASGCNRTASLIQMTEARKLAEAQAAAAAVAAAAASVAPARPSGGSTPVGDQPTQLGSDSPGPGQDGMSPAEVPGELAGGLSPKVNKRHPPPHGASGQAAVPAVPPMALPHGAPADTAPGRQADSLAAANTAEPTCIPMNLTYGGYGTASYSMGGSQDSTYEYFPKQYLLLGGLVPKYQAMHEKVVDAVKKHLLFRPLIKDDRDILFSAKVMNRDGINQDLVYSYEVSHLTCFLGGMFAMGGRIFGRPEDVEIGARLADGCAWAYESMPMGIMPEWSIIAPCTNASSCPWNETAWHDKLDPNADWRARQMENYEKSMQEWEKARDAILRQQEERRIAQAERERVSRETAELAASAPEAARNSSDPDSVDSIPPPTDAAAPTPAPAEAVPPPPERDGESGSGNIGKRDAVEAESPDAAAAPAGPSVVESLDSGLGRDSEGRQSPGEQSELDAASAPPSQPASPSEPAPVTAAAAPPPLGPGSGRHDGPAQQPLDGPPRVPPDEPLVVPPQPTPPESREEYVRRRIKREGLPPGFTSLNDRKYILRPEAIESIWYMYRITGDRTWQDKGWAMFQAVVQATRTEYGHSAVSDVTADPRSSSSLGLKGLQTDSMESFWLAETLKYFYLLFAEPDVISLDEYVLNTEAHPFKRPT